MYSTQNLQKYLCSKLFSKKETTNRTDANFHSTSSRSPICTSWLILVKSRHMTSQILVIASSSKGLLSDGIPAHRSRSKRIPCSYPSLNPPPPFSRILDEKTQIFQLISLILRSNKKKNLSKQNAILFSSHKIKYPFRESEINLSNMFLCTLYFTLRLLEWILEYLSQV